MPVISKKLLICLGIVLSSSVFASERSNESTATPVNAFKVSFADTLTPEDAKIMSLKASELINRRGRAALAEFSRLDSGFMVKDGFVFCMTLDGVMISHPIRPQLIGKNLAAYSRYGQPLFQAMMDKAVIEGEGWVEYKWPYPGTSELRQKLSYVVKNNEGFFCAVTAFK